LLSPIRSGLVLSTQHLFELCTETFLVQLFFLFPNPEMVLEARAKMLDWFAYRFKEAAAERAKAIRLDQKLHKLGEIDDTAAEPQR
jgi:hypothetical protein